jgi:hypothetical protein
MTRTAVVLMVGTPLTSAAVCLGTASPVKAEPLNAVCTDPEPDHHRSCEVGYLAMYVPHGPTSDCDALYDRVATLHPQEELLKPDFVAGCGAAHRERIELGVTRGLDP